jgi:hypothetical protein
LDRQPYWVVLVSTRWQSRLPGVEVLVEAADTVQRSIVFGRAGRAETATDPAPFEMFETVNNLKPKEQWRPGLTIDGLIADMEKAPQLPGVSNAWTMPIKARIEMLWTWRVGATIQQVHRKSTADHPQWERCRSRKQVGNLCDRALRFSACLCRVKNGRGRAWYRRRTLIDKVSSDLVLLVALAAATTSTPQAAEGAKSDVREEVHYIQHVFRNFRKLGIAW